MTSSIPPMTPELKSIAPYLQRAEELRYKDPIIAYWCAYYAAQIGISLKAKDTPSRNLLFELLGTLEMMKREIGPSEALDIEAVSSAYVENFALKVFATADNEDRKGDANRSTAKKFLAAANFLEVLKVFPKVELSESNEEKIRYAKWKAADIAKAYREGRNPTPGPAVSAVDSPQSTNVSLTPTPPANSKASSSSPKHSPPQSKRSSPPPILDLSNVTVHAPRTPPRPATLDVPPYGTGLLGVSLGLGQGESTPGTWSTAATPGTAVGTPMVSMGRPDADIEGTVGAAFGWEEPDSPTDRAKGKRRDREREWNGSDGSSVSASAGGGSLGNGGSTQLKKAWVSGELEGTPQHPYPQDPTLPNPNLNLKAYSTKNQTNTNTSTDGIGQKSAHSTPSVVPLPGGSPPAALPGSDAGLVNGFGHAPSTDVPRRKRTTSLTPQPATHRNGLDGTSLIDSDFVPPHQPLPPPPPPPFLAPEPPIAYAPNVSRVSPHSAPQIELTPNLVAKAQKHCRFAISALDYEDAEQARRELRAALAVLDGVRS